MIIKEKKSKVEIKETSSLIVSRFGKISLHIICSHSLYVISSSVACCEDQNRLPKF